MTAGQHWVVVGAGLVSTWRNPSATYWRGLLRALSERGHRITLIDREDPHRRAWQDMPDPLWARTLVWAADRPDAVIDAARAGDVVLLDAGALSRAGSALALAARRPGNAVLLCDVSGAGALPVAGGARAAEIARFDGVVTGADDPAVHEAWVRAGALSCIQVPPGLDPSSHRPIPLGVRPFDLALMANAKIERERKLAEFFTEPAALSPSRRFGLAGVGFDRLGLPQNVSWLGHVPGVAHNAFNGRSRLVLNLTAEIPLLAVPARVFEAIGAGACVVTDPLPGIERFFEPGLEIIVVRSGDELRDGVLSVDEASSREIGRRARARALAHHTYDLRAARLEAIFEGRDLRAAS